MQTVEQNSYPAQQQAADAQNPRHIKLIFFFSDTENREARGPILPPTADYRID